MILLFFIIKKINKLATHYMDPEEHWINLIRESDFPHEQIKSSLLFIVSVCQCRKIEVAFFFFFKCYTFFLLEE